MPAGCPIGRNGEKLACGRDVGDVVARRRTDRGLEDVVYDVGFAFAFRAFHPAGVFHVD